MKRIEDMIIFEDREILVCHKPAGFAVQNARIGTMDMESMIKNYLASKQPEKVPYVAVVHRLDQPVEGVLVFAKTQKAEGIKRADKRRKNEKRIFGSDIWKNREGRGSFGGLSEKRRKK